jgi:hypothetical protein
MNRQFLPYPMHIPRVTTMPCPGQSPVDTQQNLVPFNAMTMSRPSHAYIGTQQEPPVLNDTTMSCPGRTFRHGVERVFAPVYTPSIPTATPAFRFGYQLANTRENLGTSHVQSSSNDGQYIEASKASGSTRKGDLNYRKRDLHYLTPSELATNQMLDNFAAFLHAEVRVFAQVLPSGKLSEFERGINTVTKTITSLKFSPNDPIGNLTTEDLRYSKIAPPRGINSASKAISKVKTPTAISLFGHTIVKEADRPRNYKTKTELLNQTIRLFGKVPPECSAAVKQIKQELQDNPNKVLSNTPIILPKEDSNVTSLEVTLSNPTGAQSNSPPTTDNVEVITLYDLDTMVTSTSMS